MSTMHIQEIPNDVAEKVLRRVEVAKMARKLQDRLALASYKTKNGMNNLSFPVVEAHLEESVRRKRPRSGVTTSSDTSSTTSDHAFFADALASSPITAATGRGFRKHRIRRTPFVLPDSSSGGYYTSKRNRAKPTALPMLETSRKSWKAAHKLPESSPIYHHQSYFPASHRHKVSHGSTTSPAPHSPPIPHHLFRENAAHMPHHSFSLDSSKFESSPPRTPPPTRVRPPRQCKATAGGEEGADLLLYLATSPSPATLGPKSSRIFAPSTPPSNPSILPSSMMSTPGGGGFGAGFNTPGQQFNFADFVNITPSPAQGAFGNRTPGLAKTPLAAKDARRKLNFDSLAPPSASPGTGAGVRGSASKETGLGMELGGELVS